MKGTRDFREDLAIGHKGEQFMANIFTLKINELTNTHKYHLTDVSDDGKWDFKATAYRIVDGVTDIFPDSSMKPVYGEVKTDMYYKRTGNLFIELKSRGRKSGLNTTKSDWTIYFFMRKDFYPSDNIWIIKTHDLKKLINEILTENPNSIIRGGDDYTSEGVLVSREKYRDRFQVITWTDFDIEWSESIDKPSVVKTEKKIGFEF